MIQSKMKDTLIEIKNNLPGIKSGVDEAENQISDSDHKKAKDSQGKQQEEKESKKMSIVSGASGASSSIPTFTS